VRTRANPLHASVGFNQASHGDSSPIVTFLIKSGTFPCIARSYCFTTGDVNDLDGNNIDHELAKASAGPQKKLYFHDGTSP